MFQFHIFSIKFHICNEKNHPDAPRKEKIRMRILEFVSKIGLNLAELINSGIVSYVVTKVAENTEHNKKVKRNIKERANVCQTSAPDNTSEDNKKKDSSDKQSFGLTISNCKNCKIEINVYSDKE